MIWLPSKHNLSDIVHFQGTFDNSEEHCHVKTNWKHLIFFDSMLNILAND